MIRRIARRILRRVSPSQPESPPVPPAEPLQPPPMVVDVPSLPDDGSDQATQARIRELVASQRVVLFMKGVPSQPQCGFSQQTVGALNELAVPYRAVNVLADDAIRAGVKVFANWPTIPQVYVDGEFIGGCDIVTEMSRSGELAELVGVRAPVAPPSAGDIHQTPAVHVQAWIDAGDEFRLLDVRTPQEWELARVPNSSLLTRELVTELETAPRNMRLAFICHHGIRSQAAAQAFQTLGFTDLHNVVGGISEWSRTVDPSIPQY